MPDFVTGQQTLISFEMARDIVSELAEVFFDAVRQVSRKAADAEVVGGHPGAGDSLIEIHNFFTLAKAVDEDGHGADIQRMAGQPDEVAFDAGQLGQQYTDHLGPLGNLVGQPQKLFHRQHVTEIVVHRSQVIESVGQGQHLMISPMLGELLDTTVQKADVRDRFHHCLAIQLQNQAQHPVSRGMLGTHIDGHGFCYCHKFCLVFIFVSLSFLNLSLS